MKLASVISAWDGIELLKYAVGSTLDGTDIFIIVYQVESNFGEIYDPLPQIKNVVAMFSDTKFVLCLYTPTFKNGTMNEIKKRNLGLEIARSQNATHFYFQDVDELYRDFTRAKHQYIESGKDGSVCPILTYFKKPTLRFPEYDNYYVPFIHKLHKYTVAGHSQYPYYVDPTRKVLCDGAVLLSDPMHHFSWVRMDIERKARNSSARDNIKISQLIQDYNNPLCGTGFYVKDFRQKLIFMENYFNIEI